MEILGVKFAPLLLPIERRLQTLAVFYWISTFLFLGFLTTSTLLLLAFSPYKWITILYITWLIYDWNTPYTGGRSKENRWKNIHLSTLFLSCHQSGLIDYNIFDMTAHILNFSTCFLIFETFKPSIFDICLAKS